VVAHLPSLCRHFGLGGWAGSMMSRMAVWSLRWVLLWRYRPIGLGLRCLSKTRSVAQGSPRV